GWRAGASGAGRGQRHGQRGRHRAAARRAGGGLASPEVPAMVLRGRRRRTRGGAAGSRRPPGCLRTTVRRVRDPNDDYLVALAEAADAVIVTGDSDLLHADLPLPVTTPRELLDRIG